jgi:hypothetical protein
MHGLRISPALLLLAEVALLPPAFAAASPQEGQAQEEAKQDPAALLQSLRARIDAMKADYEKRIRDLETQVQQLEVQMLRSTPEPEAAALQPAPRSVQTAPGVLNPAIGVVGNFVGRADSTKVYAEDGNRIDNKLSMREAEIDMRVPVDPYADAVLITAFGAETPGRFSADVEEGYVNIKKLPFMNQSPLGLKLQVGRFRPSFGRTNILHTHDLPQTYRPLPIQEFLGEEGFIQSGVSGNFFIPTPWSERSSLDATLQVLTGGDVALSPDLHSRVSYLGHLRWFRTAGESHNLELGWSSYYHPSGNTVARADFHGVDFLYRWKPLRRGEWRSFLLGGELLFARRAYPEAYESPDVARGLEGVQAGQGKPLGYTIFTQWQFDRRKYAGVRFDQTDVVSNPAYQRRSVTPYFSYYFSEFLRFRLNYEHRWSDLDTENGRNSVFAELNFVFGSHPPEPFWVNK